MTLRSNAIYQKAHKALKEYIAKVRCPVSHIGQNSENA